MTREVVKLLKSDNLICMEQLINKWLKFKESAIQYWWYKIQIGILFSDCATHNIQRFHYYPFRDEKTAVSCWW